jgi:hypothetical protein
MFRRAALFQGRRRLDTHSKKVGLDRRTLNDGTDIAFQKNAISKPKREVEASAVCRCWLGGVGGS